MPVGVSWRRYLTFSSAAMLAMFLGSHTVHMFYSPMKDFDKEVEKEKERLRKIIEGDVKNT